MTATITADFREEFEQERGLWLRRRVLWYTGIFGGLSVLQFVIQFVLGVVSLFVSIEGLEQMGAIFWISMGVSFLSVLIFALPFLYVWRRREAIRRSRMIGIVFWIIVVNAMIGLLNFPIADLAGELQGPVQIQIDEPDEAASDAPAVAMPEEQVEGSIDEDTEPGSSAQSAVIASGSSSKPGYWQKWWGWALGVFLTHMLASLFIPWTGREARRPMIPLVVLNVLLVLIFADGGWFPSALAVLAFPLIGVPGVVWAWWRSGRFKDRFTMRMLKSRYREMRQDLVDARRIHEALFPQPIHEGAVRFAYLYEPMRQIGGDFLFARYTPSEHGPHPALNVLIIDVTGHGVPAALTVNRLHGEIQREYAVKPNAQPGELLTGLNAYVHATLADHSVYVTALCVQVDPNLDGGTIRWASGGHPPAFIRRVDGTVEQLNSTTFVLGACHGNDFRHEQSSMPFGPGDALIAYTDGATEARDRTGRMLRIDGLLRIVAGAGTSNEPDALARHVLSAVEQFRFGPAVDDTLVVEVSRPLASGARS